MSQPPPPLPPQGPPLPHPSALPPSSGLGPRIFSPREDPELERLAYLLTNAVSGNIDLEPFNAVLLAADQMGGLAIKIQARMLLALNVARGMPISGGPSAQRDESTSERSTSAMHQEMAREMERMRAEHNTMMTKMSMEHSKQVSSLHAEIAELNKRMAAAKASYVDLKDTYKRDMQGKESMQRGQDSASESSLSIQRRLQAKIDNLNREKNALAEERKRDKMTAAMSRRMHERSLRSYMKASVQALKSIKEDY